ATLSFETTKDLHHLRRHSNVAHYRNAALGEMPDCLRHACAAFELHGAAAGLLHHTGCTSKGDFRALFVAAERHVDHDKGSLRATHNGFGVQDHQIQRHAKRGLHAVDDHSKCVADQHDIYVIIEKPRGMGVIAG